MTASASLPASPKTLLRATPGSPTPPRRVPIHSNRASPTRPRSRPSHNTRELVVQVARDAVVETLRTEMGSAKREGAFAATELEEVREACRLECQRVEQEKQRLSTRLKSQKARLDELAHLEENAGEKVWQETREKRSLELKLKDQEVAFQEERVRERNGARSQLNRLQQRCRDAEELQASLESSCSKELGAVEAFESRIFERQMALEAQERDLSKMSLDRDGSQVALEVSMCESAALKVQLVRVEHEERSCVEEVGAKEELADEEAQRCAELRFELLHALHHELPSERSRVSELEARERAEAERLRGVCEAEISDLPPGMVEKVQSATRRHENWLCQWSNTRAGSPGRKRDSGYSDHRNGSGDATVPLSRSSSSTSMSSAVTRYEAVIGALAQCAGAAQRENMEFRARLVAPTTSGGKTPEETILPPDVQKELNSMKRKVSDLREENRTLRVQKQLHEDTALRLRRDMQALQAQYEQQIMAHRPPRKIPGGEVLLHTEHRRKVKVLEAEARSAGTEAEDLRAELSRQEGAHTEIVGRLQEEVIALQQRCRDASSLRQELREYQSMPPKAAVEPSASTAQKAEVQQRLEALHRRLGDLAGGKEGRGPGCTERELERELFRLCERLEHEAAAGRRERRALADQCRSKDLATIDLERRCAQLEATVRQRDSALRDFEHKFAVDRQLKEVESLRDSLDTAGCSGDAASRDNSLSPEVNTNGSRKRRSDGRVQLDKQRDGRPTNSSAVSSTSKTGLDEEAQPVATLLQRWVKGAIERWDGAEIANSQSNSPSSRPSSSSTSPIARSSLAEREERQSAQDERQPVANLLQRWVTKALENDEERSVRETPDEDPRQRLERSPSRGQVVDRIPVKVLLSRWVKKAVENTEEDEVLEQREIQIPRVEPLAPRETLAALSANEEDRCDESSAVAAAIAASGKKNLTDVLRGEPEATTEVQSDDQPPLTPRSPTTKSWIARLGMDFTESGPDVSNENTEPASSPRSTMCASSSNAPSLLSPPAGNRSISDDVGDGHGQSEVSLEEGQVPNFQQAPMCEWRSLPVDTNDTSGMMNWLSEIDRSLPMASDSSRSFAMSTNLQHQRLPSVAEEPTSSPEGIAEDADPEEAELEELFQRAEAFCDDHCYDRALPIFRDLLTSLERKALEQKSSPAMRGLEAEVRAHMGVTLQSLGLVEDAIEAYSSAVQKDPSLHVCHANLAQLYSYLEDPVRSRMHLNSALRLDPTNAMYTQLDEQFRETENTATLRV